MVNHHPSPYRTGRNRHRAATTRGAASCRPSYDNLREVLVEHLSQARENVVDSTSAAAFALSYLQDEVLSKYDPGDKASAKSRRAEAIRRFWQAEQLCKEANERLLPGAIPEALTPVIRRTQEIIRVVLGPLKQRDGSFIPAVLNRIARGFGWGPGATTRVPRRQGDPCFKFSGIPEVTASCAIWGDAAIRHVPRWTESIAVGQDGPALLFNIAVGNRVITVPKNSKTERCISIEPDLNIYVQKGFGRYIRERLLEIGVNLNDQSRNQRLSRVGSIVGSLATVDLSMASDTVSRGVVRLLVPPEWRECLEDVRSDRGVLPSDFWDAAPPWASRLAGDTLYYQKFSSMGNGFTFELETLIFWALTQACTELHLGKGLHRVSVYGDDIICPSAAVLTLLEVLDFLGFRPNEKKSFWEGDFRESCGKHYFAGHDVSPFYVRRPVVALKDAFLLANNLRRFTWRTSTILPALALEALDRAYERIRDSLPKSWRKPRIPDGFGDGALIGFFDECTPQADPNGTESWRVQVLADVPERSAECLPFGALIKAFVLLELQPSEDEHEVTPVAGVRTRKIPLLVPWRVTWP